ncbi:MAG TPA: BBP7 family outer membrane beta-barrel protein [Gemmataceae bacterium]|nr:BBP7 family outer membrane beta-barrel protein [Gemmataceae bacterium]
MKSRFVASMAALLAGTGLALAQSAGKAPQTTATEAAAPDVVNKIVNTELPPMERPVTPYWPNPLGPQQCALPTGMLPGAPSKTAPGDGTEAFWASAEYMVLWNKKGPLSAPLVTTGGASLGALGASDTAVLFGGKGLDFDAYNAFRVTSGFWFDRGGCWGLEGSFFITDRQPLHNSAVSDPNGNPLLARPVINALTGQETTALISDPGILSGNVTVNASSRLFGYEANLVNKIARSNDMRLEWLVGFRSIHLDEDLAIIQNSLLLPGGSAGFAGSPFNPPGGISITDRFDTTNNYYGGQIGARGEYHSNGFFVNATGKIGIGDTHEVTNITGITAHFPFSGTPSQVPGGLLALTTNSGRARHDMFAVVPEVGLNVGYQINPLWRVFIGYNFLYLSDVARPGDQINRTVNPNFVPISQQFGTLPGTPLSPAPLSQRTDFWVQGINLGIEFRY